MVETLVRIASALEIDAGSLVTGVTSELYGSSAHRLTAREFIRARTTAGRGRRTGS